MHQSYKKDACIVLNFVISVREPQITVQPAKIIIISLLHQFVWLSARRLCIHLKTYASLVHRIVCFVGMMSIVYLASWDIS